MRAFTTSDVAQRLSSMSSMVMPHFPPFPAAYPFATPGLGGGIYPRGGGSGGRGGHQSGSGGRGGLNANPNGWQWNNGPGIGAVNGGWGGDAGWHHAQRGPVPWMAGAEVWGHTRSGGNNFNWANGGGGSSNHSGGGGRSGSNNAASGGGRSNKNYSSR